MLGSAPILLGPSGAAEGAVLLFLAGYILLSPLVGLAASWWIRRLDLAAGPRAVLALASACGISAFVAGAIVVAMAAPFFGPLAVLHLPGALCGAFAAAFGRRAGSRENARRR